MKQNGFQKRAFWYDQLRPQVLSSRSFGSFIWSLCALIMSLPRDEMAMLRVADYVAVLGIDWSDRNISHIRDPGSSAAIRELREHESVPMACIDRSPASDHEGFPFPSNLAMFAFPHGSTVSLQGSCVAARMTSFILSARNEFDKVCFSVGLSLCSRVHLLIFRRCIVLLLFSTRPSPALTA